MPSGETDYIALLHLMLRDLSAVDGQREAHELVMQYLEDAQWERELKAWRTVFLRENPTLRLVER